MMMVVMMVVMVVVATPRLPHRCRRTDDDDDDWRTHAFVRSYTTYANRPYACYDVRLPRVRVARCRRRRYLFMYFVQQFVVPGPGQAVVWLGV